MLPDRVLNFEPPEAQALEWLPLAVRYKLDGCGLKIRLHEWQALPRAIRKDLVHCPAGPVFGALISRHVPGAHSRDPDLRLPQAGDFERYVAAKRQPWGNVSERRPALDPMAPASHAPRSNG